MTAVLCNGIYVLGRDVQNVLGKYNFNLAVWNHDETLKISLIGSATPLLYRGNFLVLCTGHQIKGRAPEDIVMVSHDGAVAVTSSGYSAPEVAASGLEYDLQDIVVFLFNDACSAHPELRKKFFRLEEFPPDCTNQDVVALLSYGFPSQDQLYELEEKNHIGSRMRTQILKVHGQPSDPTLLHCKPLKSLNFDPDGLSGGPNYVLQRATEGIAAYFAGITVRAGRDDFYIVKSGHIKVLLDAAIDLRS